MLATLFALSTHAATLQQQREAFRAVYPEAELANWQAVVDQQDILRDYVLWPDLRAAWLRASLARKDRDDAEVNQFLNQYGTLKPARELRYRYSLQLASEQRMPEYLAIYQQFYQGLEIAKLDCLALHAELLAGEEKKIVNRAQYLWLVGKSQAEECDPVFEHFQQTGQIDRDLYEQRYELAIAAKQFSLARYVSKSLDQVFYDEATQWLAAQNQPANFIRAHATRSDEATHRKQLAYAAERLAYSDPALADELWQSVLPDYSFAADVVTSMSRHIALWSARTHQANAYQLLSELPTPARDTEVRRWQARSSLRAEEWHDVITSIESMNPEERETDAWRYWYAQSLRETGRNDEADSLFGSLAQQRNYYGFLAADAIDDAYALSYADSVSEEKVLESLSSRSAIIRARELYFTGLEGRGRSEWDNAVANLNATEKMQAALLARRWGWHSRAIATAASVGQFDDLRLRYPLPYQEEFSEHAAAAQVSPSWAYGVARSESLFMRDVRSSAGAIGLMQLMPATGKSSARQLNQPYYGRHTLTDPSMNILLGTYYLGKMFGRFDNNMAMATAAYNAGPHRVERWRPQSGSLDARIWIENIPYKETRGYVRRVLETDVIFHWRLTGNVRRISDNLESVPAQESEQLAITD